MGLRSIFTIAGLAVLACARPLSAAENRDLASAADDSVLASIAFNYQLNWNFVSNTAQASQQILNYTPLGISYGLNIPSSDVVMSGLQPYDTQDQLGYMTTIAEFYIPAEQMDALYLSIQTSSSRLYQNPDSNVNTLMSLISPDISAQYNA